MTTGLLGRADVVSLTMGRSVTSFWLTRLLAPGSIDVVVEEYSGLYSLATRFPDDMPSAVFRSDARLLRADREEDLLRLASEMQVWRGFRWACLEEASETARAQVIEHFRPELVIERGDAAGSARLDFAVELPFADRIVTASGPRMAGELANRLAEHGRETTRRIADDGAAKIADVVLVDGFYAIERSGRRSWAWTGAGPVARFGILLPPNRSVELTVRVGDSCVSEAALILNGSRSHHRNPRAGLSGRCDTGAGFVTGYILHDRGAAVGARRLGLAIDGIEIDR